MQAASLMPSMPSGMSMSVTTTQTASPASSLASSMRIASLPLRASRTAYPLKRLAQPEEVANMVAYLCTPAASATTGAALRVDGGVLRGIA